MTSRIMLSLLGDEGIPLVARVSRDDATQPSDVQEIVVPVTGEVEVTVRPGSYGITLLLPTGRTIRRSCDVADEPEPVVFDARGALSINLADGDRFSLQGALSEASPSDLESAMFSRRPDEGRAIQRDVVAPPPKRRQRPTRHSYGRVGVPAPAGEEVSERRTVTSGRGPELKISTGSDFQGAGAWRMLADGPRSWQRVVFEDLTDVTTDDAGPILANLRELSPHSHRTWVKLSSGAGVELGAVPLPWHRGVPVAVSVDPSVSGRAMTDIAVRDGSIGALLSYLGEGRLSLVSSLIEALGRDAIEQLVNSDAPNPLAACAVAYALLATCPRERLGDWQGWMTDLAAKHAGIPDCSIVLARFRVLRPGVEETLASRGALVCGYEAGVPFYSIGLLMLRDMLTVAAATGEGERLMLQSVAPVAARCDPVRLFTVLRYPDA